ncbi:MAG: ribulose-phosphate 3-epimerase [Erysipelotrichaceae bacterium]|nr:ribulose-phosphate 3-epimerase [Erysipelotrichaceae bacterium]
MVKVAPSVLSADFTDLKNDIKDVEQGGAKWLHYDVMDGHFVPNISFGADILKQISKITDLYLDVHLMVSDPAFYADRFIAAGADLITFHIEAMDSVESIKALIDHLHEKGVKAGLSIKPGTKVDAIKNFLDDIDLVLVMSVEPGFGGQSFMSGSLDKIRALNEREHQYLIEVDGGINAETGKSCVEAGVDVLVAGSYVFNAEDRKERIASLL